ncbi:hypothetical protein [Thalassospira sp. MIT1370]|uniref:hypothetical protein n=1 Tax=unclassified Thalassospira TaxID=2648997 RepID=UPI00399AFA4C
MDILSAISDWVLGFFIFVWRSPAFSDASAWAQAIAILITGLAAVHAAGKAYKGAIVQANATREQVRTAIALHQQTMNREAEREASEVTSFAAALAAEMLVIAMEVNQVRLQLRNNNQSGAIAILKSSPLDFPIYDSTPANVAKLGVGTAFAVVGNYNEFRTHVRYWKDRPEPTDVQAAANELAWMKDVFNNMFKETVDAMRHLHRVAKISPNNPFERWFVNEGLDQELPELALKEA